MLVTKTVNEHLQADCDIPLGFITEMPLTWIKQKKTMN